MGGEKLLSGAIINNTINRNENPLKQEVGLQNLVKAAVAVKEKAYCPYSNFRVGAAVMTNDGTIYSGSNVENASYGLSMCAERVAIMNAVSHGHTKLVAAAVSCDIQDSFQAPCGACRQFFAEFNLELELYMTKPDMTVQKIKIADLLPMPFTPDALNKNST